ncbi:MAG: adenosylhomocysteine nucleosidase [Pirellulaceae bacterium]|jgi:adenosylhomocysteine nucleosidase
MLLRFLVNQFVRQVAEQKLQATVSQVKQTVSNAANKATKTPPKPEGDEPQEPVPKVRCELVFSLADSIESSGLLDLLKETVTTSCASHTEYVGLLPSGRKVAVIETGASQKKAGRAVADAISFHRPQWLVSCGFASSLNQDVCKGHILLANEVTDGNSNLEVGLGVAEDKRPSQRGLHFGRLLTVDKIITNSQEKRSLSELHNALACDTESMAIASACADSTRMISVRVITDNIDDQLPPELENLVKQRSFAGKMGAAVAALWNKPSRVKDMWNLRDEAIKASNRLARFLLGVADQLPAAPQRDDAQRDDAQPNDAKPNDAQPANSPSHPPDSS